MARAEDLKALLSPARHKGEAFKAYRRRRKTANASVEQALKGRLAHESTRYVSLPAKGEDTRTEEAILRGQIRDVQIVRGQRMGRLKGNTYRKSDAV